VENRTDTRATVPSSNVKVRRHANGGLGPRARVRSSVFDPGVVHLALADQGIVPDPDELAGWVDAIATRDSVRAIRTGALFAEAAERFAGAGFAVVDTLMLFRADLDDPAVSSLKPRRGATVTMWPRQHGAAAQIDRAAFGAEWSNGPADLAEIRRATASHRARARRALTPGRRGVLRRAPLVAFAITGAAGGNGYLQRLAVMPEHQRQGHGRALTVDSLAWMRRRRLGHAVVNTGADNEPARALYESTGFRPLNDRLVVMQLDLVPHQ
jgi:ribosomal protein S18 acetylase RimI-like enzyme